MATVTVKFGVGNVAEVEVPQGTTIAQAIQHTVVRGKLGLGSDPERYDAYVQGVNIPLGTVAPEGVVISLQSRQCTKNSPNSLTPAEFTQALEDLHGPWDGENY